jgi:phosphatidylglycerophosphate synthase
MPVWLPPGASAGRLEAYLASRKQRPARELLCEYVFRPLAHPVVVVLLRLGVRPPVVVLAHTAIGFAAAVLVVRGQLVGAALLLQLKTVLDNADGQLARAADDVTPLGRYLDTEADLLVNVALLAGLAVAAHAWVAAPLALGVLTVVLSVDFNFARLVEEDRGAERLLEPGEQDSRVVQLLARIYGIVFEPQDRLVRRVDARRLAAIAGDDPTLEVRLAYHDTLTARVLANLGLSTQLAVLGVCLVIGRPLLYVWLVLACAPLLAVLQLRRERRARAALRV